MGRARGGRIAAPFVLVLLACFSVASWGNFGTFVAQGDLFPITTLNPSRWLVAGSSVWHSHLEVGGDLIYTGGYFLSSLLEVVPAAIGVPVAILQRIECAALLAGILLSMYGLLGTIGITTRVAPRFLGSVAFGFSLALVTHTVDLIFYVTYLTVTILPLLYAYFLRASPRAAVAYGVAFVVASQLTSYLFINPPQLVIATIQVLLIGLYLLYQQRAMKRIVARSFLLVGTTFAASVWWIVPAFITTFNPSIEITAITTVADWAWTHARASFINDWRFISSWGWALPQYFPWATYYQPRLIQIIQLWPLPAAALAVLLSRRKVPSSARFVLSGTSVTLIAVFLVKGLHPPLEDVNLWIYQHVPGFFLFREATTKFDEPLSFGIAVLLVTLLSQLAWLSSRGYAIALAACVLIVATLAVPAFTGMVTEDASPNADMGDAQTHVAIPTYWYQLAAYMRQLPAGTGYALLPNDDYYQQLYNWHYYGVDILPMTLLPRPVWYLYDSPQGYSSASQNLDRFGEEVVAELHNGDTTDLARQFGLFGIGYVVVRHDVASSAIAGRSAIPPQRVAALLRETRGLSVIQQFGALDLYAVTPDLVRPRIFAVPSDEISLSQFAGLGTVTANATVGHTTVSSLATPCATPPANAKSIAPTVEVLRQSPDSYTVRVTAERAPTLLVLNQSFNPGWTAIPVGQVRPSVCAGPAPEHVLANGFANAWWITDPGTTEIRLTFTPQRAATAANIISGTVLATCSMLLLLVAVLSGLRRPRESPGHVARS